jgi:AcrR family transcriptional regulator
MATKAEQSDATRRALVAAAQELFAEHGFADTSTEAVVQAAGVTRGALYHHFKDKTALFQAVYEDLEQSLVNHIVNTVQGETEALTILRKGSHAFLDGCLDPAILRVVLLEAPTVLGWQKWREIDQRYGLGLVRETLQWAMEAGTLRKIPVDPLAHILLAGLAEAGMLLANAPNRKKARKELGEAIDTLIDGLAAS